MTKIPVAAAGYVFRNALRVGALLFAGIVHPAHAYFTDVTETAGVTHSGESYGASWGDFNGDGWTDLWVGNHADNPNLYLNDQQGGFEDVITLTWPLNPAERRDTHGAAWLDVDQDNDDDLVESVGGAGANHVFINENSVLNERAAAFGLNFAGSRNRTVLGLDWNQDSRIDLFIPHELAATAYPILFTGSGSTFVDAFPESGFPEQNTASGYIADITEDGIADLILTTGNRSAGPILNLTTRPISNSVPTLNIPGVSDYISCSDTVVADFNGDLREDIFSSCGGGGRELIQRSPTRIEARMSSVAGETAIEFTAGSSVTLSVFPSFTFSTATHFRTGSSGILPPIIHHPELGFLSFTTTIDASDSRYFGSPNYMPGQNLGLFVSFNSVTNRWRIALSAPGSAILSLVITAVGPMESVATVGFQAVPSASAPIFLTRIDGGFTDARNSAGLNTAMPCPSAVGGDFDNDRDVDIYLECSRSIQNLPNMLLLNDGVGRFSIVANAGGALGSPEGSGESVTTADYDRDGDLDLFVLNGEGGAPFNIGPHQLYRNDFPSRNWLEIDLVGGPSNSNGIGAIITLTSAQGAQRRTANGGFHRRSQNSDRIHFGLGTDPKVDALTITWPSGSVQAFTNVRANRVIEVRETENPDDDNDGVPNFVDNCPGDSNSNQSDNDQDWFGDICDLDRDGDGIPNDWEVQHQLNPADASDGALDYDQDLISNLQEYLNGTNPRINDIISKQVPSLTFIQQLLLMTAISVFGLLTLLLRS